MTSSTLTKAQSTKLSGVVDGLAGKLKIKASDEAGRKNLERFCDKYLRFKLNVRGTGPHSHGFDKEQRALITSTIREAFGIKAPARKAPAKGNGKKAPAKKGSKRGTRKSTAQLAKEQAARAAEHPVPGTQVLRQG